mgnify:FL=1
MKSNNRKRRNKSISLYVGLFNLILLIVITGHFTYEWNIVYNNILKQPFLGKGNILMVFTIFLIIFISMKMWGGFKLGYSKLVNLVFSQFLALITIGLGEFLIIALTAGTINHMGKLAGLIAVSAGIDFIFCVIYDLIGIRIYLMIFPPIRLLQVNGDYDNHLRTKISNRSDKYEVCEEISIYEGVDKIYTELEKYDAVLLNDIPNKYRKLILKYCFENDIPVYYTPKIQDIMVRGSDEINLFDSPLFLAKNIGMTTVQAFVKRAIDIIGSTLGLIVLSPVFLIVSILIKIEDGGKVFFMQDRCTYDGKVFRIHKFRSMKEDAEKDGKPHPATSDDDRITKVGKFIRATRIDELPQLVDIWIGNMSIVGPRPERVEHVAKYTEDIPEFGYRLKVKGGLTGYAQVYGRYNTTSYDKLKMDLIYVVNYSLLMDFQIVLETVKIIFSKESTEGFTEENSKKMNEYGKAHDLAELECAVTKEDEDEK